LTEIEERIFVDAYESTRENENYTRHTESVIRLGRKIMKFLGPHSFLFLEYEKTVSLSEVIYLKNVYRIGVKDGQELSQLG
jgi:hypothetical protein